MIHPVICNPVLNPVVDVLNPVAWLAGGSWPSGLPVLAAGEYYLIDESGNYLTDENGNYLIGKDS
jgi:hypothetical protein